MGIEPNADPVRGDLATLVHAPPWTAPHHVLTRDTAPSIAQRWPSTHALRRWRPALESRRSWRQWESNPSQRACRARSPPRYMCPRSRDAPHPRWITSRKHLAGLEPASPGWKPRTLPLSYRCTCAASLRIPRLGFEPRFQESESRVLPIRRPRSDAAARRGLPRCTWLDSNQQPTPYQDAALPLSYRCSRLTSCLQRARQPENQIVKEPDSSSGMCLTGLEPVPLAVSGRCSSN